MMESQTPQRPRGEPVVARMRIVLRGRLPTGRALQCGRCGQRLPTLSYLPLHRDIDRQAQRDNGGLSPHDLYLDWREMPGWWFDGETLRPTEELRGRYQRAREKVRTTPGAAARGTRAKLASGKGLVPSEERQRQGVLGEFPQLRPAPRFVECVQCGLVNLIDPTTAQHPA